MQADSKLKSPLGISFFSILNVTFQIYHEYSKLIHSEIVGKHEHTASRQGHKDNKSICRHPNCETLMLLFCGRSTYLGYRLKCERMLDYWKRCPSNWQLSWRMNVDKRVTHFFLCLSLACYDAIINRGLSEYWRRGPL